MVVVFAVPLRTADFLIFSRVVVILDNSGLVEISRLIITLRSTFGLFVRALFDLNLLRIALRVHFLVLKPVAR